MDMVEKRRRQVAKLAGVSRSLAHIREIPVSAHLAKMYLSEAIKTIDDIEIDLRDEALPPSGEK